MLRFGPLQLALADAGAQTARKQQAFVVEPPDRLSDRACPLEEIEDETHCRLHLRIGIEIKPAVRTVYQTHRRIDLQFPTASLVEDAATQPCFDDVQFGFAHGAFQSEQKPIVKVTRIVNAILVKNDSYCHCTQLYQLVPVGTVAGQA